MKRAPCTGRGSTRAADDVRSGPRGMETGDVRSGHRCPGFESVRCARCVGQRSSNGCSGARPADVPRPDRVSAPRAARDSVAAPATHSPAPVTTRTSRPRPNAAMDRMGSALSAAATRVAIGTEPAERRVSKARKGDTSLVRHGLSHQDSRTTASEERYTDTQRPAWVGTRHRVRRLQARARFPGVPLLDSGRSSEDRAASLAPGEEPRRSRRCHPSRRRSSPLEHCRFAHRPALTDVPHASSGFGVARRALKPSLDAA